MRRTPFRRKILLSSSALLIGLIVAMLIVVDYQGGLFARTGIEREIEDGRKRVKEAEQQRVESLWLTASFVAAYPSLRPLMTNTDGATIRDHLEDYQQQN